MCARALVPVPLRPAHVPTRPSAAIASFAGFAGVSPSLLAILDLPLPPPANTSSMDARDATRVTGATESAGGKSPEKQLNWRAGGTAWTRQARIPRCTPTTKTDTPAHCRRRRWQ